MMKHKSSITLIGMPGAGKSTVGVLLAKTMGKHFIDTDLSIQNQTGKLLQPLLNAIGFEKFIALEEQIVLETSCQNAVIAPGGSVVYSERAMQHLQDCSFIICLQLSLENIEKRLSNIATRGVLMRDGQTMTTLYRERMPLYEAYADWILPCDGKSSEEIVQDIVKVAQ